MRRFISFILVFSFLIPCFFVSAKADEVPNFMELLDYGYVHHDGHYVSGNRTEIIDNDEVVYFNLPYGMTVNYVDILFYASASVQKSVSAGLSAWDYTGLYIKQISEHIYRAYGYISEHTYEKIEFKFSSTSTSGYVNFYSVKVQFSTGVSQYVSGTVVRGDGFGFNWDGMSEEVWTSNPTYLDEASLQLIFRNWTAFDSITLYLDMRVEEITSIRLRADDGTAIPFDYSVFANATEQGYYLLSISFDLNGVRDSGSPPILEITYKNMLDYDNYIHFYGCSGFVSLRYPDPELYWFQEIYNSLVGPDGIPFLQYIDNALNAVAGVTGNIYVQVSEIFSILSEGFYPMFEEIRGYCHSIYSTVDAFKTEVSLRFFDVIDEIRTWGTRLEMALTPNLSDHEESMDQAAEQATEIQDAMQDLEQMEKPEVDDIPSSITTIITGNEVIIATQGLGLLMMNPVLRELLTMAFTLALAAYVLFGKR